MTVRTYRRIHRWLGLIVGVQLLLWTASGLFFSLNPIEKVRGETEQTPPPALDPAAPVASPQQAMAALLARHDGARLLGVTLRPHLDGAVFEIAFEQQGVPHWALADAATGALRGPVARDEAVKIATRSYAPDSPVQGIERITDAAGGSEYRGRPLPAYRVSFDDPLGTRLYVSAERGVVTARRNDRWRLFDLLWMFHIMDYRARDDFNSLLLQFVSGLGLLTVLSGFALFAVSSPRLRRLFRKQGQPT